MPTQNDSTEPLLTDLQSRIADGRAVAVVGAGVSISVSDGNPIASWSGLLQHGIRRCQQVIPGLPPEWANSVTNELKSGDFDDLLSVAQKVESKLRRVGEFPKWLIDSVGNLQIRNGALLDAIRKLRIPIMTTNYDGLIEKQTGLSPVTWREPGKYERTLQGEHPGVIHLHGFYEDPDSIVLGINSYDHVLKDEFAQAMQRAVRSLSTLVFIGFGNGLDDPNFAALFDWARKRFADSHYRHYRLELAKDVAVIQSKHSQTDRIFVVPYGESHAELHGFINSLIIPNKDQRSIRVGPSSAADSKSATATNSLMEPDFYDYLAAVRATHENITFVEIPLYEDTPDIQIDNLFVEPTLSSEQILPDRPEHLWPTLSNINKVLEVNQKIVVLGDPGFGKSTLTSCLCWRLCSSGSVLPIPMIVRELQLKADITWEGLLDCFLQHRVGKLLKSRQILEQLLREGRAVVFLDGLDEIGNLTVRRKLRDAVHDGMSQYSSVKWVLTSRVVGYEQVPFHLPNSHARTSGKRRSALDDRKKDVMAKVYYLAPFKSVQISEFAKKWYDRHEKDAKIANDRATMFINAINDNPGTKRLARVPYLLTLMALIHRKAAKLPHGRTDLYDRISTAYLESIDARRNLDQVPYSLTQKKRWLADAGYQMQLRRGKRKKDGVASQADILASQADVHEWLSNAMAESGAVHPKEEAQTILDYIAVRSGLLVPRGEGLFAFMHLSLQEYFAASCLEPRLTSSRFSTKQRSIPSDKQLYAWANQVEWLEVYVLLFEMLAKKDATDTQDFFDFLFADRFKYTSADDQSTAARLLAELVVDPFVVLNANTRRRGRNMCWRMEFFASADPLVDSFASSEVSSIAQMLVSEQQGDLREAWNAAGFSRQELRDCAVSLNLTGCANVSDLSAISGLANLTSLSLAGCRTVKDLSALSNLKKLVTLNLDQCRELRDLSPLKSLRKLVKLSLKGCTGIDDFTELVALKSLAELDLPSCSSFDALLPISALAKLVHLSVGRLTMPVNLAHLKKCTNLTSLLIDGSVTAQDLAPLAQLPSLKAIHLHEFPSDVDLSPLTHLPELEYICLAGTSPTHVPQELADRGIVPLPAVNRPINTRTASRKPSK